MTSVAARLVKFGARRLIKRQDLSPEQVVRHLRHAFNQPPGLRWLPAGVRVQRVDSPGLVADRVSVPRPRRTLLYFHGGAFIAGTPRTYHNLAGRLAAALNAEVYLARYPFAPEHPFPAAVNSCLEAWRWLLDQGCDPQRMAIGGDSAGGSLTLSTLLGLRDQGLPAPAAAFVYSPATDARQTAASIDANDEHDAMLSASLIRTVLPLYLPDPADRLNPLASPVLGDLAGLPPLLITAEETECLFDDARTLRERAEAAGVDVEWIQRRGLFHVWPIMVPWLPEAREDVQRTIRFLARHL